MIVRRTEAGQSWTELAQLDDPLAAVIDPGDSRGRKNRLIDRVHKHALAGAVGDVHGSAVLDFGCGTGRLSAWLVDHGAQVDGVDVTPEMVSVARTRVPGARFQTLDGSGLPFSDASFDLVISAFVLQYYVRDSSSIPADLARVLRAGGRLIAIEQVTDSELGRGGPSSAYERMLATAGFVSVEASPIRLSDSRIIGLARRVPLLSRLPLVPRLVTLDARRRLHVPLVEGRYADVLFRATKPT